MKIEEVNTYILKTKLKEPFSFSQRWFKERTAMLLEVKTDEGLIGWGEAYGPSEIISPVIENGFKPYLIGRDPTAINVIWEFLYNRFRDYGQKGIVIEALSAVDIALWDITGKMMGVPVYKLLGGAFRKEINAYATGLYVKESVYKDNMVLESLVEEAEEYVKEGYKAIKLKIGFGPERDIKYTGKIREAIGPDIKLMVDANHAYNTFDAIKVAKGIEKYNIDWFEEPVIPEDIQGYIEVKNAINIPIAGGECEFTRFGFKFLIENKAVDYLQPDTCSAGGLSECIKIVALASAYGVFYNPHVWGSGIAIATNLHLISCLPPSPGALYPREPMLEYDNTENPFRTEILKEPLIPRKGKIKVPEKPGLGIDIDRDVLKKYCVRQI